jgi:hypothetical protein
MLKKMDRATLSTNPRMRQCLQTKALAVFDESNILLTKALKSKKIDESCRELAKKFRNHEKLQKAP